MFFFQCPRQRNAIDCGYFIMRFMKEVIMEYPNKIPDNVSYLNYS